MTKHKLSFRALFDSMDTDSNNLVSLPEFQSGLSKVISLSAPIVEQLYHLLDANAVGLVNYEQFLDVLKTQKFTPVSLKDNFDWELSVVDQIAKWIATKSLNAEEAFKVFDKDFDGFISKQDLRTALVNNVGIPRY